MNIPYVETIIGSLNEIAVEPEGYGMGALGSGNLGHADGIENEEKRPVPLPVENERKQQAFTFISGCRRSNEHRLSRITAWLRPDAALACLDLHADQAVEEIAGLTISRSPNNAIGTAGSAAIVDPREFNSGVGDLSLPHTVRGGAERNHIAVESADRVHRFPSTQTGEVELIDDTRIGICDEVEHQIITSLEGVDVMKGEHGFGFCRCDPLTAILRDDMELQAALRLPAIVLKEPLNSTLGQWQQ